MRRCSTSRALLAVAALQLACAPGVPGNAASPPAASQPASATPAPAPPAAATPDPTATPDAAAAAATDAVFASFAQDGPGCAVGVRRGSEVLRRAYGLADVTTGEALTPEAIFDVGSVSKQVTGGALMLLVLDGRVGLDDDVHAHLPSLPPYRETVTVADLVHHTSGLPDYTDQLDAEYEEVTTAQDALAVLSDGLDGPAFTPGTRFAYSNSNYFLLGQLVEAVTGATLGSFAEDALFAPLAMERSRYRDDQHDGVLLEGQAAGHAQAGLGAWDVVWSGWQQTGDGAVHTTVGDLLRWAAAFTGPPSTAGPGSQAWRDLMLTPGAVPDEDGYGYGAGLVLDHSAGRTVLSHSGAWVGYSSALVMEPAAELAVAVACNVDDLDAAALADATFTLWSRR